VSARFFHFEERLTVKRILLLVLVAASATEVSAQACLGLPTLPGQFALGAQLETETTTFAGYGARVVANTPFGFAVGASYRYDELPDFAQTGHTFGGLAAVELPMPVTSICPVLEVLYSTVESGTANVPLGSTLRVPLTLGVGQRIDFLDAAYVVPSARAGVMHVRHNPAEGSAAETWTTNNVIIGAEVTAGRGVAFLNTGVTVTTEDETEPRFHFGLGILLP
jgi:hypothetical protein